MALLINVFVPFFIKLVNAFFDWGIKWKYSIPALGEYLVYLVVGYLLNHYSLNKKRRVIIYIGALIGLGLHIVGTSYLSRRYDEVHNFFKGYLNAPGVIYSIGIFVFVKQCVNRITSYKMLVFVSWFQKYTFAIYLMHMFVFEPIAYVMSKAYILRTSPAFTVMMTLANIPICIIVTHVLRKIPVLKAVVP